MVPLPGMGGAGQERAHLHVRHAFGSCRFLSWCLAPRATSSAMVGESCVPPQVPGEADAQRAWLSDAAAKLVAVCP